jgi:molecular chaperone DnaK (HSP70)
MQISVLGIDLGKNSCSVAGQDGEGRVCSSTACQTRQRVYPVRCFRGSR